MQHVSPFTSHSDPSGGTRGGDIHPCPGPSLADHSDDGAAGLVRRPGWFAEVQQACRGQRRRHDQLERVASGLQLVETKVAQQPGPAHAGQQLTDDPRRVAPGETEAEEIGQAAGVAEGVPVLEAVPSLLSHDVVEDVEEVLLILDQPGVSASKTDR